MASIGDRLREERLRLAKNQPDFAALGHAAKRSQIRYESGEKSPDANYLAGVAAAGADALYIVTGRRVDAAAPALNSALLREVLDGIETGLTRRRQRLTPDKKAELIVLLYERFADSGKADRQIIDRHLRIVA